VIAVEADTHLTEPLKERFGDRIQLIGGDALTFPVHRFFPDFSYKLIANIPYNITSDLLRRFLTQDPKPDRMILMVQKEVGERLCANPGESAYSKLTLAVQMWFEVTPVCRVPRSAFYPVPKVDSMVVRWIPRSQPAVSVQNLIWLKRVITGAFQHRRKTLWNALKLASFTSDSILQNALHGVGLDPGIRPQQVSLAQYGQLADVFFTTSH
jgi:16S rRNA (adenine1518-N6/adenine1519-N6)-dimethyltransferase